MLQTSEPPVPPNKFIAGEYIKGTSAWSVDSSGDVTISSWGSESANQMSIKMERMIDIEIGDSVQIVVTKLSGSISAQQRADAWLCGSGMQFMQNDIWGTGDTPVSKTKTASAAPSSVYFTIRNKTGTATFSSYKFKVEVYVNGVKKFPEV